MPDWEETSLGDLVEIKHGFAFKGQYFSDTPPGDVLLTPGNFAIGGGFQFNKLKYYDGPNEPDYTLQGGELLVTMTDLSKAGDTLGYPAIVPVEARTFLHNQRLGKVVMKSDAVGQDFIYWLMRTPAYRSEVLSSYTGSTVKHTSPTRIQAFRFIMPPRDEREAIVASLSSLDDKIELNRRMNETLEEMARALFRDWFVDFGPTRRQMKGATEPTAIVGHAFPPEKAATLAPLFPAVLGDDCLPEGWRYRPLNSVVEQQKQSVKPDQHLDEEFEHFSLPSFDKASWPTRELGSEIKSNKTGVPANSLLVSKLNPRIERVWVPQNAGEHRQICSTEFLCLKPAPGLGVATIEALFRSDEMREKMAAMVTGTSNSHQRVPPKVLMQAEVLLPGNCAEAFEGIGLPLLHKRQANERENQTLAEMRDLLLPKLISGEIRLKDTEGKL
ncbi:restriction endonuclease subunit S [Tateyamaria sp. Alg231-49]|uniref:restriction endonuclease subunit S n=1 Tax=Tateyamaria sp. Alg231-49 TaxID=1922219 RepID=UPI000D54C8B8|nr:restriction endonuclease subunit S [Tateyamaria sp. Alg231-49]